MSVPAVTGVLELAAARERAMAALAPAADTDPNVQTRVDAVSPPALIVLWADPWLEPVTGKGLGRGCTFSARLVILAVAGALDAGAAVETLERLVTFTIDRLRTDAYSWAPPTSVGAPYSQPIGGVSYLAAAVRYRITVYTEGA